MATLNDYREREHWSYSSINQFLNICSLQWGFQRVYKTQPVFTPAAISFGSTFHRVMEAISSIRKEGKSPVKKDAMALFNDLWHRQVKEDENIKFDEDTSVEDMAKQGQELTACIMDAIDPAEQIISINEPFAVPIIDADGNSLDKPLIGEIDLVIEKDDRKLVDWKTSARRWPKFQAKHSMQPTVLLYAYKQLHGIDCGFRFDVVVKNKTPVFEQHETTRTPDQFNRMVELIKLAEKMVQHEHFCPNETSFYCDSCPYDNACSSWHRERSKLISVAA